MAETLPYLEDERRDISEMIDENADLESAPVLRRINNIATQINVARSIPDNQKDQLVSEVNSQAENILEAGSQHPLYDLVTALGGQLNDRQIPQEVLDEINQVSNLTDRDAILKAAVSFWRKSRQKYLDVRTPRDYTGEQFAQTVKRSEAQEKPVLREFRKDAGLDEENLTMRQIVGRLNEAAIASLRGGRTEVGRLMAVMHAKGDNNYTEGEMGLLTEPTKRLRELHQAIRDIYAMMEKSMKPGSEMVQSIVEKTPQGTAVRAGIVDTFRFGVSDDKELKRKVPVEIGLYQTVDWWVGNTDIKTDTDSFVAAEDIDLTLAAFNSSKDVNFTKIKQNSTLKLAAKERIVLDETNNVVFEPGQYIDIESLTSSQQATLKLEHYFQLELVSLIKAGTDFRISQQPDSVQTQLQEKIKYHEVEVFRKQLFTSEHQITYMIGNRSITINAGEEFIYEDLPADVRKEIAEGKYRVLPAYIDDPFEPNWKSPGEHAYGQRSDVNERDLYDPFFEYVCRVAGVSREELTGMFGPEGIHVGPYLNFVKREVDENGREQVGLIARAIDATDVNLSLSVYHRNFHGALGDIVLDAHRFLNITGRAVTQFDPLHEGKLLSRFWEYTLGAEGYDEAKAVSDLYFRQIMTTLYPDFFGRIWKQVAFYKMLHGETKLDITELVYPYGDPPNFGERIMAQPVLPFDDQIKLGIAIERQAVLLEKEKYGIKLTASEERELTGLAKKIDTYTAVQVDRENFLEMLMTENKAHWMDNREELFLNYVYKTSERLAVEGRSPEYITGFIEKTTLGYIESDLPDYILEQLDSVKPNDRYFRLIANTEVRKQKSDARYLRNIPGFAARLSGASDNELELIQGLDAFNTLMSYANETEQANLQRLHQKCPEMFTDYMGMMQLGSELLSLRKIDYGEYDRMMEDFMRYLMYTADVYKVARKFAVDIVQSIDPSSIGELGRLPNYKADDPLAGLSQNAADWLKERAGIMGKIMASDTVQAYLKTLPETIQALVESHAHFNDIDYNTCFQHVIIFVDQLLDSGLQYVYETTADDNRMPGKADQRYKLTMNMKHKDENRKKVYQNMRAFVQRRGFRVNNTKNPTLMVEGGHPAYSRMGGHLDGGQWQVADFFADEELREDMITPLTRYGVLEFLRKGAIANLLIMYGQDMTLINDSTLEWWAKHWQELGQQAGQPRNSFFTRHQGGSPSGVLIARRNEVFPGMRPK